MDSKPSQQPVSAAHRSGTDPDRPDEALLLEYRETGQHELFGELVRRYQRELFAFLCRTFGDTTVAEDAFQTTFMQVHVKCNQFDEGRRFRPWLYAIATHVGIDLVRWNRPRRAQSLDAVLPGVDGQDGQLLDLLRADTPSPGEHAERREQAARCRAAVQRLPERLRVIIQLLYFGGLKYREAAEALSIPVGTVKSRAHEAVSRLRAVWKEDGRVEAGGRSRAAALRRHTVSG
jgi:RNA polymerase sigma-70 factor (ECF subfamily)